MASADPPRPSITGNLALYYQESLTPIVRLRSGRQTVQDAQYFREQFIEALKLAKEESRNARYSDGEIRDARFAVVAFLDETILNLRNPVFADWVRRPLQEELFGVHVAGQVFFENVERLNSEQDSPRVADVLEVYLLCLCLGYAGKYSISGRGELETLKHSLLSRIRRIRGDVGELSPAWRPIAAKLPGGADSALRPLLYSAIAIAVLVIALFIFYKVNLGSAVEHIQAIGAGANS